MLYFDIETAPLPDDVLARQFEFTPPTPPEPFDERQVKVGNMKDPEKIRAKIEEARARRDEEIATWESTTARARDDAWQEFKGSAALAATTCRVIAIGTAGDRGDTVDAALAIDPADESRIITQFWRQATALYNACRGSGSGAIVGHNILDYDLPVLVRRSWCLSLAVPTWIRRGRYWSDIFCDTIDLWSLGQRRVPGGASLDVVSKALGGPGKFGGVDGAHFHQLLSSGDEADREKAIEYLRRDVLEVRRICSVMTGKFGIL